MTPEASGSRRILDRPGRVAAVGGAAVVCLLSVSGALGLSGTGLDASGPHRQAADSSPAGSSGSEATAGDDASGGPAGPVVKNTPQQVTGPGSTDPGSTDPDPPAVDPPGGHQASQGTALPANSGSGKRVVFDVSAQRVWLVNADDSVERTYLVSGSKFSNLDNGTYQVTSRSRYATAYNSDEKMDYMVRFTTSNRSTTPIGFHSIPRMPDGTLVEPRSGLGAPASDGCIRQWLTDAHALWNFAPDETTVVVRA